MIARPLTWVERCEGFLIAGDYVAFRSDACLDSFIAFHRLIPGNLGRFHSMEAAQAACDRHHQIEVAKMLSADVRKHLWWSEFPGSAMREIIDAADRA